MFMCLILSFRVYIFVSGIFLFWYELKWSLKSKYMSRIQNIIIIFYSVIDLTVRKFINIFVKLISEEVEKMISSWYC
jgi:hypothetical protein